MADLPGAARVTDRATLHNELERLGDVARQLHDETWSGTVSEHYALEVVEAHKMITARLVAAGHSPALAAEAVASWVILGRSRFPEWSVLGCVDWTLDHVPALRP